MPDEGRTTAMCPDCEDFARTVLLLGQLALYADTNGADLDFVEAVSPSLAASLPEPPDTAAGDF
jgi:D-Tyr-tRNAtyr deacylase